MNFFSAKYFLYKIFAYTMTHEKFNLNWHTYTDHLREMLHDIMNDKELSDVTLICEDKKQFKAHKLVLSASSPVFKDIISTNLITNPVIYLRGIESLEIESILQFIYLGQATIFQERMNEFINVAKSLEIKEISKDIEDPNSAPEPQNTKNELSESQEYSEMPENNRMKAGKTKDHPKMNLKGYYSIMNLNDESQRYQCHLCDKTYADLSPLGRHIKFVHEGVEYPCDQCNRIFTQAGNLSRHIKSAHNSK